MLMWGCVILNSNVFIYTAHSKHNTMGKAFGKIVGPTAAAAASNNNNNAIEMEN
jgi:hypothetical protein